MARNRRQAAVNRSQLHYNLSGFRRNQMLDSYWLELLMAIVGEQFEGFGEFICGAVVNVRQKGDKVSNVFFP